MFNFVNQLKKVTYSLEFSKAAYLQPQALLSIKTFHAQKEKRKMEFSGYFVPKEMWSYDIVHYNLKCYYRQKKSVSQFKLSNQLEKEKKKSSELNIESSNTKNKSSTISKNSIQVAFSFTVTAIDTISIPQIKIKSVA